MNDETLLHRQINPGFIQDGRVTSQAFRPTPKDESKLSVYDGDLISPGRAWLHFSGAGLRSAGVMSVTVDECGSEGLACESSPEIFPEHAHIDFTSFAESQRKSKGKRLLAFALARGWQYRPESIDRP